MKVLPIGKNVKNLNIEINQKHIDPAKLFKYPDEIIDRKGNMQHEISEEKTTAKIYPSKNSKRTKMRVHIVVFRPMSIYGNENWVLSK